MFRYERPQKGRHREFFQLGLELINGQGVAADVQILSLASEILNELGIADLTISLNYLGNRQTKDNYKQLLEEFLNKEQIDLCADCQRKKQTNSLRILDCKICNQQNIFPKYNQA
jgi:histidyl-tRNA synthetase